MKCVYSHKMELTCYCLGGWSWSKQLLTRIVLDFFFKKNNITLIKTMERHANNLFCFPCPWNWYKKIFTTPWDRTMIICSQFSPLCGWTEQNRKLSLYGLTKFVTLENGNRGCAEVFFLKNCTNHWIRTLCLHAP